MKTIKGLFAALVLAILLAGCANTPPDCFNASSMPDESHSWIMAAINYWDAEIYLSSNCVHTISIDNNAEIANSIGRLRANGWVWTITLPPQIGYCPAASYVLPRGHYDMPGLLAHEIGHTRGLDHSNDTNNIMHAPPPFCFIIIPEGNK